MLKAKQIKRFFAMLMALMLLISAVPVSVLAEPAETTEAEMKQSVDMDAPNEEPANEEAEPPASDEAPEESLAPDDTLSDEPPVSADVSSDELPASEGESDAPTDEPPTPTADSVESVLAAYGHAYVLTAGATNVYSTAEMTEPIFTVTQSGAPLLATEYVPHEDATSVKVWFLATDSEALTGYVDEAGLMLLTDEEANVLTDTLLFAQIATDVGEMTVFLVEGEKVNVATEAPVEPLPPQEPEPAVEESTSTQEPEASTESEATLEPAADVTDQPLPTEEIPLEEPPSAQVGDFVAVTPVTRVFSAMDDSAANDYDGDLCLGVFVNDACVQVEAVEQDSLDRYWFLVRYLYGDTFADGRLKWTETDTVYVLASETAEAAEQDFTVTDYAFSFAPSVYSLRSTNYINGISLKNISAPIPSFYVGQGGVYGSSGKDSDYLQIAKLPDHGTIYATPHYLDGYSVYCLEHNYSGPGENISGGGQEPTGPYVIVDIDSYRNNPGYSGIIFSQSTMHAIAWVLRHTYPFMALDRNDSDNETWSRVAGQFAIREVIKQMEGAQYVRYYWDMDNFYRASGQAPAEYLEYARWLAANGIARGSITGNISVSNKSVTASGGAYVGTVTLTTDADLMRISKSAGYVSGNTAGEDGSYYYLNSGDTISVTSSVSGFSITVESVSSEDEEASFLVGVPSVEIQKVLIPQYGAPYKLKSVSVQFEVPLGSVSVTKKDAQTGATLAGATFELLSAAGSVLQTQVTGANGIATFANLQPGTYTVREKSAPRGYALAVVSTQSVAVTAGTVSPVTFTNDVTTAKIRIVKKDQLTKQPLAGVEFTVTRLSAPAGRNGIGEVVAILTTDANGAAETGWLDWGRYRIEETKVPEHYVNNHFSTEIEAYEEGKTYTVEVENEATKGFIRLVKTDRRNGNPIEGVQFDIYYNDEYGSELACTMVTGADGVALSDPLRKGRYIVQEHGATAGYLFEEIALDATVKPDETTELQATNCPVMVKLKLYKRDAEEYDGDNPNSSARPKATSALPVPASVSAPASRGDGVLTGAEFRVLAGEAIKDRQGNTVYNKGDVVIESLKTEGDDASATTGELWLGLYEIVEVTPPVGYQPSDKSFFVDARSAGAQSTEAVITYEGLKTNEILVGAFGVVKFTGDNEVHEDAGIVETPEKGAEFEVYLKSAGSYANARDVERDYLVTNKYGRATTKALPYGVYVLRQVVGKEGYAVMRPIDVMIDGTEDLKDPPTLILNNQAIHYRLRIVKIDAETGKPILLAGTAFKLKDAEGNYIKQRVSYPTPMELDTFTTNESGEVTLPETVTWGQYFIEEIQSPEGYVLGTEDVEVFVGRTGDEIGEAYEVTVEVPNKPVKGSIAVEKKGLRLTGFEVRTDDYGNEYQHPVYEEGYLAGVMFEVRAAETIIGKDGTVWYEQDALVDTITTTAAGADRSKELPLGRYYLVETEAPAGYVMDSTHHEVELSFADNQTLVVTASVAVSNTFLPAEITLQKEKEALQATSHKDGTVSQTIVIVPGEGFVFGLYNAKDIRYGAQSLMADTLVATGATGADGSLTFSGCYPHGDYYIKELSAPVGWKLNPNTFPVTLDPTKAEGNIIRVSLAEAVLDELVYGKITLTKTDITGEKTLPGAQIEVRNEQGEVIYRAITDENGQIPDIPVTPGKYIFREVLAPDGYALSEAEMSFTVDEHGNVTGDTAIRDDYTRVTLLKQNESGQPLAGVEFALRKADGSTLMTAVSNEIGLVTFEKIPYGSYTIVEIAPPTGYLKSEVNVTLKVDGSFLNSDKPIATVINRPTEIILRKKNTEGKALAGAAFALLDAYGRQVMAAITNGDGMARFLKVPYGQYIIRETQAPDGYNRMDDIALTVDASWTKSVEYDCVDIPNHYEFMKVDSKGNPLAGVKFMLEDSEGNDLRELVSDDKGMMYVNDLTPGTYVIRETAALEGFTLSDEIIRLSVDEQYTVSAEPYRFVNHTGEEMNNIQTGFEMTITPVMWAGVGLMFIAVVILVCYGTKRKGKKRRK